MEKSLSQFKPDNEDYNLGENQTLFRCDGCKEAFRKPLLATVSSGGSVQKYYACPHCLARVTEVKHHKSEESKETSISMKNIKKAAAKHEDDVKCKHSFGYLKDRPKDMPIPDECLTCDKMIQCMIR